MTPAPGLEATLGRVSLRMAGSLDVDEVLAEITRGLVHDQEAALARVWLLRRGTSTAQPASLHLVASAWLSERVDGSRSVVPIGTLKIGEIAETRTPVCSSDLLGDPRFVDKTWIREQGLVTFAGYPLAFGGELLGVLAIFTRKPLADQELERLGFFAAQASVAIKNASLFAEVTELSRRLEAENAYLKEEIHESAPSGIVGSSPALTRVLEDLERVAKDLGLAHLGGWVATVFRDGDGTCYFEALRPPSWSAPRRERRRDVDGRQAPGGRGLQVLANHFLLSTN